MSLDQTTISRRKCGLIDFDSELTAGGYSLYAGQTAGGRVDLIDIRGEKFHEWNMPVRPGRDAVILPNGNLGYNGSHKESANLYPAWDIWHGGHFMEANYDGEIVWEHEDIYHHHDAQWLPNGNLLYTVAVEWNGKQSDIVKEVNRKGEVVWEWKAWEHLSFIDYPIHECFNDDHWPLINGVHQTSDGLVLMSLRTTSGIIAVNKSNGEIVWKFLYPNVAQQHCPVETENRTILCFDNGNIRPKSIHHSRILEFNPNTQDVVWTYTDPMPASFFSPYMGSAQRLWNGNTFICESAFGRLFEVTSEGEIVWEYVIPEFAEYPAPLNEFIVGEHNSCFKAHRYEENLLKWL